MSEQKKRKGKSKEDDEVNKKLRKIDKEEKTTTNIFKLNSLRLHPFINTVQSIRKLKIIADILLEFKKADLSGLEKLIETTSENVNSEDGNLKIDENADPFEILRKLLWPIFQTLKVLYLGDSSNLVSFKHVPQFNDIITKSMIVYCYQLYLYKCELCREWQMISHKIRTLQKSFNIDNIKKMFVYVDTDLSINTLYKDIKTGDNENLFYAFYFLVQKISTSVSGERFATILEDIKTLFQNISSINKHKNFRNAKKILDIDFDNLSADLQNKIGYSFFPIDLDLYKEFKKDLENDTLFDFLTDKNDKYKLDYTCDRKKARGEALDYDLNENLELVGGKDGCMYIKNEDIVGSIYDEIKEKIDELQKSGVTDFIKSGTLSNKVQTELFNKLNLLVDELVEYYKKVVLEYQNLEILKEKDFSKKLLKEFDLKEFSAMKDWEFDREMAILSLVNRVSIQKVIYKKTEDIYFSLNVITKQYEELNKIYMSYVNLESSIAQCSMNFCNLPVMFMSNFYPIYYFNDPKSLINIINSGNDMLSKVIEKFNSSYYIRINNYQLAPFELFFIKTKSLYNKIYENYSKVQGCMKQFCINFLTELFLKTSNSNFADRVESKLILKNNQFTEKILDSTDDRTKLMLGVTNFIKPNSNSPLFFTSIFFYMFETLIYCCGNKDYLQYVIANHIRFYCKPIRNLLLRNLITWIVGHRIFGLTNHSDSLEINIRDKDVFDILNEIFSNKPDIVEFFKENNINFKIDNLPGQSNTTAIKLEISINEEESSDLTKNFRIKDEYFEKIDVFDFGNINDYIISDDDQMNFGSAVETYKLPIDLDEWNGDSGYGILTLPKLFLLKALNTNINFLVNINKILTINSTKLICVKNVCTDKKKIVISVIA